MLKGKDIQSGKLSIMLNNHVCGDQQKEKQVDYFEVCAPIVKVSSAVHIGLTTILVNGWVTKQVD
jgi:hypothetical protein